MNGETLLYCDARGESRGGDALVEWTRGCALIWSADRFRECNNIRFAGAHIRVVSTLGDEGRTEELADEKLGA